jgi:hypothetical protein
MKRKPSFEFARLLITLVGLSLASACAPEEPAPPEDPVQTLAALEADYDDAQPSQIARQGDRLYMYTGSYCLEGIYVATLPTTRTATPVVPSPLLEKNCFAAFAIDDRAIYGELELNVVACPLDAPCTSPRVIDPVAVGVLPVASSLTRDKLVMLLRKNRTESSGPGVLLAYDLAAGGHDAPIEQFDADAVPAKIVAHGAYVYYVRPAPGGSAAKSEAKLERVAIGGGAPPEVLAANLPFVADFDVDDAGVVLLQGDQLGSPATSLRSIAFGGASNTLGHFEDATRLGLSRSSVVVFDTSAGAFVRISRQGGLVLSRVQVGAQSPTSNFLATEQDVLFGTHERVLMKNDPPRGRGLVRRVALGGSK